MASRLKRQLNRHCTDREHPEDEDQQGETAETRVRRAGLGGRNEVIEREPKTLIADTDLEALWAYILGLARVCGEELQDKPSAAETDGSQTYDYVQIPLDVTVNYRARAKRFTASFLRALLPLQREELSRRFQPLQNK